MATKAGFNFSLDQFDEATKAQTHADPPREKEMATGLSAKDLDAVVGGLGFTTPTISSKTLLRYYYR